jgi:hypothetical protein
MFEKHYVHWRHTCLHILSDQQGKVVHVPRYPTAQEGKIEPAVVKGAFMINYRQSAKWRSLRNMNAGLQCAVIVAPKQSIYGVHISRVNELSAEELGITSDFRLTSKLYVPLNH